MNDVRDAAMTALIFGFFASGWFGWAQERPPVTWKKWLGIAGGASLVVAAAAGAIVFGVRHHRELIAPWVCFVVGAHFVPLAGPLASPILYPLAVVMILVAAGAVPYARRHGLAPSAVTGVGAGVSLFACAAISLVIALTL